jgi:Replicative DNA helicase
MAEQSSQRRSVRKRNTTDNTYAHVQPQATEIERAVLGALMIDKDAYTVVCEMLYPESFYEPRNQKVYEAIRELEMKEQPVDVWTVTEQLSKQGDLEDVGGPAYITELSSRGASSAKCRISCSYHCPEVLGASTHPFCE